MHPKKDELNDLRIKDHAPDSTLQTEAQQGFHLSQALLDSLPHPVMLVQRNRKILAANDKARQLGAKVGGYCWRDFARSKFISKCHRDSIENYSPDDCPAQVKCTFCMADEALDGKRSIYTPEIRAFDRLWDTWWVPVDADTYLHYAIDVTDQKETENKLKQYRDELEGIVEERTAELKSVNNQLWYEIIEHRKTEQALRESEERFRSIFEKSKAIKLLIDPKSGNIVDANPAACTFYGYPIEQLRLMNISQINTLSRSAIVNELSLAVAEQRNHFFFKHKLASGEIRDVEVHASPININRQDILFSIVHDITERRVAEELLRLEHNKFLSIANSTENAVFIIDPQFEITYLNPVAEKEFGPVANRKCHEYFHDDSTPCPWCQNHASDQNRTSRWVWTSPNNHKTYDVFDAPFPGSDGTLSRLEILHDVTEHKRIEEALRLDEAGLAALLKLSQMAEASLQEITEFVLDQAIKLTNSEAGAIGFMGEDPAHSTFYTSFKNVSQQCVVKDGLGHFPLGSADLWTNTVSRGKPLIINDYPERETNERGYLENHTRLHRLLLVPVAVGERLTAIAATANKGLNYESSDVRQLTLLLDGMGKVIQRRRSQQSIKESQQQLRILSSKLLRVREDERKYLAKELHDKVGQAFAAIKYGLESILKTSHPDAKQSGLKSIKSLIPMVQKSIDEVRRMYTDLRPTVLDDFGVIAAVDWLCREFREDHRKIRLKARIEADELDVPSSLKIIIFRLVQEALNNIAKHSRAHSAHIRLFKSDGKLTLIVSDDGIGFDLEQVLASAADRTGVGLASIKELTKFSAGSFAVESTPGAGTTLSASWPI